MLALVFVAISVGLSNFAASIAIGLTGVDARLRLRLAIAFGMFEGGMPILGLLLGRQLTHLVGSHSSLIGGLLLIATGIYSMLEVRRRSRQRLGPSDEARIGRLIATSAALSIDNLIVGFALGTYHVSLAAAAITIAAISVAMSLAGLELGSRLGERVEHDSELIGGGVLVAVGIAIAAGVL